MVDYVGTFNQVIKGQHGKMGGALVVSEGHPQLLVGGFNYNLSDLPEPGEVLPCGTPVYCDEQARTITPVITAKVASIDGTKVTLEDNGFGGTPLKAGDYVAVLGNDLSATLTAKQVTAKENGLIITLASAISGLAVGNILVQTTSAGALKGVPNALTPMM